MLGVCLMVQRLGRAPFPHRASRTESLTRTSVTSLVVSVEEAFIRKPRFAQFPKQGGRALGAIGIVASIDREGPLIKTRASALKV